MNLSLFSDNRSKKTLMELVEIAVEIMRQAATKSTVVAIGGLLAAIHQVPCRL
jgi:hypothetical protein